ncbi:hypothetical protein LAZ40_05285 [Cereibacter sphaeroides]|uniref:hypothetical protein n=1 Tax=Rhodobacterales TaxID=204455 RepID=UPI000BBE9C89|nr:MULTISPECIES: hypothetical protein [Paracoccaceae]MCE6958470.1 hypothetical protein [Cereibacter sphaeroides]MCE6972675.1 hypothetical protein [Cereibacter sphaeroides]
MSLGLQLRLSLLFTAMLYLGPLVSGIGRHDLPVLPAFAALFVMWTMVMRPAQWPQDRAGWSDGAAILRVAATVATQILLVAALFIVGRAIGGMLPATPVISESAAIAISLLAIPFSRLTLDPAKIAFAHGFLDEVPEELAIELEGQRADRLVAPFFRLPDDTDEVELMKRLVDLAPSLTSAALLDALDRRIRAEPSPCIAARRALILQATSVAAADTCPGRAEPVRALRIAGTDRTLLRLLALRLQSLLAQRPQAQDDCPTVPVLRAAVVRAKAPAGLPFELGRAA